MYKRVYRRIFEKDNLARGLCEAYCSNPKIIAGYYTNAIKNMNACPLRIRSDRGTENSYIEQMQMFLRRNHTDEFAFKKSFLKGVSTANQRIEAWWSVLRKQNSQFWINFFGIMRDSGDFSGDFLDKNLIQFCFMNIIQRELNQVVKVWNAHRIRGTKNMNSPNGRPNIMFSLPQLCDTHEYAVDVDAREVSVCEDGCIFKGNLPCDKTVYEISCILMAEHNIDAPHDCFTAKKVYIFLKNEIRRNF
ncbi:Hypothetical predicted protein [Mytilus galloprovincialis]|uniref:Integrase core domain-containing protein n=1 Tax=Mytilus galloprovincialis TaxID=29158 RepID=A0A8B6CL65_MYTGA|nr:Hypothetical predicted protein [Mytilus galloprovincialis]